MTEPHQSNIDDGEVFISFDNASPSNAYVKCHGKISHLQEESMGGVPTYTVNESNSDNIPEDLTWKEVTKAGFMQVGIERIVLVKPTDAPPHFECTIIRKKKGNGGKRRKQKAEEEPRSSIVPINTTDASERTPKKPRRIIDDDDV